ncbi:cyclic nucleotide-binding domain-containing protein [Maribius pontilimi]|uniref:Cyclic nucleotide-binding domain-containing protein n=1 Tax=Palleronia pontilimi TaxID=1964209 RepID=A0A934ME97_9RHOB|nr:cyclic nucleotide-binding domain-containing protein [Palleronia pontilimi]MBJ3764295.1 cyclic nucleotide-binding domain-containing protein [Palleronia pontilimi]
MILGPDPSISGLAPTIGVIGAVIYISAYGLMQMGFLRGQSYAYASLVLVAASCVAISAVAPPNPAVFFMQVFYIAISVLGISRIAVNAMMLRSTPEERAFIKAHLPDLRPEHVRPLLKLGTWRDIGADEVLTREGERVPQFYYLARGTARVVMGGKQVGTCDDCLIGELTLLTGLPATATVITNEPCRVLAFDARRLQALLRKRSEIKLAVIAGFADATKTLLMRRNREALTDAPLRD